MTVGSRRTGVDPGGTTHTRTFSLFLLLFSLPHPPCFCTGKMAGADLQRLFVEAEASLKEASGTGPFKDAGCAPLKLGLGCYYFLKSKVVPVHSIKSLLG